MSEIPNSYSMLPAYVKDTLSGELLETHRSALRSLELLAELGNRLGQIKWIRSKGGIVNEGPCRRVLAASAELHEVYAKYDQGEVYDSVSRALIEASREKEDCKYEEHRGECFHHLVFRMVGNNINALFMFLPPNWRNDTGEVLEFLAVHAAHRLEFDKVFYGVSHKGADELLLELRREVLGAATLLDSRKSAKQPAQPRVLVDIENSVVTVDGKPYPIKGALKVAERVAEFIQALVLADGAPVPMTDFKVRTRDMENQLPEVAGFVDRQPGGGCRIPREKLWLN